MEYQSRRPFSAKSRLESTQPLTSTTPVTRIPVRSNSPSADEAIAHYNSERARALGDSARAHGSPSKLRSVSRNQHRPDSAVLPASKGCSTFVKLLLVVLLFCWQGLVFLVIYLTLRSAQDLNHQIIVKGGFGVALQPNATWAYNLLDKRLSHNVTVGGVTKTDVLALRSANHTIIRSTSVRTQGSTHSVTSLTTGTWQIMGNSTLAMSMTSCGGDTAYNCLDIGTNVTHTLAMKGNSLVLLGSADSSGFTTYTYQPGI